MVTGVSWSQDNPDLFAACGLDGNITVWDMLDPFFPHLSENHLGGGFPSALMWIGIDCNRVIVSVDGGKISHIGWTEKSRSHSSNYNYHNRHVWSLDCSSLSRELISTCADGTVASYHITPKLYTIKNRSPGVATQIDYTTYDPKEDTYTLRDTYDYSESVIKRTPSVVAELETEPPKKKKKGTKKKLMSRCNPVMLLLNWNYLMWPSTLLNGTEPCFHTIG